MLLDTKGAGEELKKAAINQAGKKKGQLAIGLGVTGAVVATVASGGLAGIVIGAGVGVGAGYAIGKKN